MGLRQIKDLREQLMSEPCFNQYGYVLKQDLIDVYRNKKVKVSNDHKQGEQSDSEDDVLLLI